MQPRVCICFTFITVSSLVLGGCSRKPASIPRVTPAATVAIADESLTSDEYIRHGLPAPDREWSGNDMQQAEKVLTVLVQAGNRNLPRFQSERSGEVFSRLTSARNLGMLRDRSLPLGIRFPQGLAYFQSGNQIFKLYVAARLTNEVSDSELVEFAGAILRVTVVMLDLVDEFLPTIKKEDPTYQVRMDGVKTMKLGLAGIVAGGLQTLTDIERDRDSELLRLVDYMQETFPLIVPRLPPGSRTETMLRLEKMQQDPALQNIHPALKVLQGKVQDALENEDSRSTTD